MRTEAEPAGGWALAVDIGGTKMACGAVDAEGVLGPRARAATPDDDDPEVIFAALAGIVGEVLAATGDAGRGSPTVCGVGCGGPMEPDGERVSPLNIRGWRGFPLRSRLAALTGSAVHVDNDAKALALGEGWRGAATGELNFLAMVVSTGVGGGIVLDGRLLDGARGNAGHIGHVIVEPDGAACVCGAQGCLEAEASGTGIARLTGRPAAEAGPDWIERTGTLVGRAVASTAVLLDLPLAVVAGSVALGYGDAFFAAAQREIDARARLEYARGTTIRRAGLGDEGPLVGAAAVGWRALGRDVGVA